MTLKKYVAITIGLLAIAVLWLFPESRLGLAVFAFVCAAIYPFARLFRAIIRRLER